MQLSFKFSPFAPCHLPVRRKRLARPEWSQIRSYHPTDLYGCLAVWLRASRRAHHFLGLKAWLKQGLQLWRGQLERATTWVYVEQGQVRGFISVLAHHHIAGLFVAPGYQGSGLGSQLLQHASEVSWLDSVAVYSLNLRARQFYERHGFRVLEVSPVDADGQPYALWLMGRSAPGPTHGEPHRS